MDALNQIISWNFVAFSLAVFATTMMTRRFIEFFDTTVKKKDVWKELVLPLAPAVFGAVGALLIKGYPYPEGIQSSGSRLIFGLTAGLLSGVIYRVIKAGLKAKFNVDVDGDSTIPAPITTTQVTTTVTEAPFIPPSPREEEMGQAHAVEAVPTVRPPVLDHKTVEEEKVHDLTNVVPAPVEPFSLTPSAPVPSEKK